MINVEWLILSNEIMSSIAL